VTGNRSRSKLFGEAPVVACERGRFFAFRNVAIHHPSAHDKDIADAAHARAAAAVSHYAPAEPRALGVMALLATAALFAVVLPIGTGVLLGTLLALATHTVYRSVVRRTRRPALIALLAALLATMVVAGTVGVLLALVALRGASVLSTSPQWFAPGGKGTAFVEALQKPLAAIHLQPGEAIERLRTALGGAASSLAGWAAHVVAIVLDDVLALFFMATTMYFVLLHWTELGRRMERLLPINPHHTRRLMHEIQRLGRVVVVGNFGTAVVQGALAGIGYLIAQIPEAAFLGALTAVASLLPVFGTMLVWVPAGVVLALTGHVGRGVFELIWGSLVVVGLCDYVVRPKLIGRGDTTSTWMTFVGLFGGIKLFGFVGFLLGPLLVGIASAILRLYARVRRFRLGLS
jgi:predicted PurR-regulated permease PerM